MFPVVRAACCALVIAIYTLALITAAAESRYPIPQPSVSIVLGTLPEAKIFARDRQRAGEWHFDFNAADEETFFDVENKAARQWREWKNHMRVFRAYRHQQEDANARDKDPAIVANGTAGGADGQNTALADYFEERQVQKRIQQRIKKHASFNTSTSEGLAGARAEVQNDIASLWDRVKSAGTSGTVTDLAFLGLVERHFSHTYVAKKNDLTEPGSPFFSTALLHTPFLLEGEVLPRVEKEVRQLRKLWLRHRDPVKADPAEVDAQLSALDDLVESSRVTSNEIISLVHPLAEAAGSWVASALVVTQDAIRANDEATEAKRMELKQLHRKLSAFQKVKQALDRHLDVFKGVLRRNQPPNAEAILFALELLAKQRFGDTAQSVIEALPMLSTTAPFTGLLEEEWKTHVLHPFLLCVLITAALMWVAEEMKEWSLRRVQAAKVRLVAGGCSPRNSVSAGARRMRKLFLLLCLSEMLVPPLLPGVMLALHLHRTADWSAAILKVMRPSQRVVCVGALISLTVFNYIVGLILRRWFPLVDPSVYRRRHAKTK